MYKPSFMCEYCEKEIPVDMSSQELGALGACGCQEAQAAQETEYRAEMERRKVRQGRRRA